MKKYIGIKQVKASPMTAKEALEKGYRTYNQNGDGYEVTYDDGYKSWCPKDVFEQQNCEIKNEELASTCSMMVSPDYKERFKAEYAQLVNRYNGLRGMIERWECGMLDFTPTCAREIYSQQLEAMYAYICVLRNRAEVEHVDLSNYPLSCE